MKIDVGKIALVAVMIAGIQVNVLYHRIDDLECQRDIYKSRYEDWEGVSKEIAEYADTLRDSLKARDRLDGKLLVEDAGDFLCTAYCTEKREHICGTGTGITASGAPVEADVTVAADPDVFPFGTVLYIEDVGVRIVQDKGAGIQGKHLDSRFWKPRRCTELGRLWNTPGLDHPGGGEVMWDKLQTNGDRRNDAEVLAIAAAGAPLDIMAMFFESHIEELPDLCVEKLAEAFDKRASNTSCHRESENWKDLAAWARIELKRRKSNGRICENTGCSDGFGSCGTVGGTDFLCACRTD